MNIHDIINARATAGNAYWFGWDGTMRFTKNDTRARYLQSVVHTYEALGVAKRHTPIGICRWRHDIKTTGAFIQVVIERKKAAA